MEQVKFCMLVGVAGSGKSTLASQILQSWASEFPNKTVILSSDAIREELYGDAAIQDDPQKVFNIMNRRVMEHLGVGHNVLYDATNLAAKRRTALVDQIRYKFEDDVYCMCEVVVAPEEDCVMRQSMRARKVPAEVIHRQICQFEISFWNEGWDRIHITNTNTNSFCVHDLLMDVWGEDQRNSHHTLCLGEHCYSTARLALDAMMGKGLSNSRVFFKEADMIATVLDDAAMYHDVGKYYTQSFANAKGEPTEEAHYYNHNNYSAYLMACDTERHEYEDGWLLSIALVQWHMQYYLVPKMNEWLDKRRFDRLFCFLLGILHEADKAAH